MLRASHARSTPRYRPITYHSRRRGQPQTHLHRLGYGVSWREGDMGDGTYLACAQNTPCLMSSNEGLSRLGGGACAATDTAWCTSKQVVCVHILAPLRIALCFIGGRASISFLDLNWSLSSEATYQSTLRCERKEIGRIASVCLTLPQTPLSSAPPKRFALRAVHMAGSSELPSSILNPSVSCVSRLEHESLTKRHNQHRIRRRFRVYAA